MKNIPLLVGTILGTLLLIVGVSFMFSNSSQTVENGLITVDPLVAAGEERNVKVADTVLDEAQEVNEKDKEASEEGLTGSDDSEMITIVEFSDFQCPACRASSTLAELITEQFPGKVKFIFRHFPLDSIHPNARKAAIASEAVASINSDKFWDMHDLLFENQNEWSNVSNSDELNDIFVTYIEKLDIDRIQFLERIEDNSVIELVSNDSNTGTQLGVNSTPTFYVDGVKVSAPQLISTVESLLVK